MVKLNRFIQFNDETIDANKLLLYERLGRALAGAEFLELTERKLFEFQPKEGVVSISVYWRHRSDEMTHAGRLSDVYLLTAGFWKHFSVPDWIRFRNKYKSHPLRKFAEELLLLLEEFRLMDVVEKERPGTSKAFSIRRQLLLGFHRDRLHSNVQKAFIADALLNQLFLALHEGLLADSHIDWNLPISQIMTIASYASDMKTTSDMSNLAERIVFMVEEMIENDLVHQYYAVGDSISETTAVFHYHEGMTDAEKGEEEPKETIEEIFRTWHRESESESGVHLEYELEHGRSGRGDGDNTTEGNQDAEIQETGTGQSEGNVSDKWSDEERDKTGRKTKRKTAGHDFGKEHVNVVYEELTVEAKVDAENLARLSKWREQQKPLVRSFVEEMKKRIELKEDTRRSRLMKGRLSTKLTTLLVDERPRPFYRKNIPSNKLDAVFGLLVDGSASMMDKLDETKKAVLLFHDVLRQLSVQHEISSYYEDANYASKDVQPNVFGKMHTFDAQKKDDGLTILSFETNEDNRDGFAIRWMTQRLLVRPEKHKFLLVFSDGEPSAFGYDRNGILDTRESVLEAEKEGVSVIHLFLASDEPTDDQRALFSMMFGNKSASSQSVEHFTDQTLRILRKLLAIVVG
ncbi:vWA domain-containing protein [Sporosarcina sp. SAFN-015]|uniref:vWA domain-containing protein n=1 Tax=Sporosarcina sp. SAFN-015 TaxID=3387274 RepID=UPI003F81E117